MVGILFFRRGDRKLANRFLSITIFAVNMHLFYLMVLDTNLDNFFPFLLWVPYSFLTAVGPLILFYTKALTDQDFSIAKISSKHFVPLAVEIGLQVIMIGQGILSGELFYNTPLYFSVTPLIYFGAAASIFYYLRMSIRIINNHQAWVLSNFSNLKEVTLTWLRKLIVYYRLLLLVWVPFVAAFLLFFRFQLQYLLIVLALYLLILVLTYLTFWIGIEGFGRGNLTLIQATKRKPENKNFNRLTAPEIQDFIERINQLMLVDKMYLNENLSLKELAQQLTADPNLVSFVLNQHLKSNFHDFINRHRVEEVKHKMQDPQYAHLSLLGIAFESGFNSKTTFNRVFKQTTGLTPTQFQKRSLKK
ncbi:MAG: AraC family transcriptional regulator [Bacteroidota bacterium]